MRMHRKEARDAFSLLEVLVSTAILVTGIVAIAAFFPASLRQNQRAIDISTAAFLAQMKVEEIRRDDTSGQDFVRTIRDMETESDPVVFALDDRFTYSFSGVSVIDPVDDDPDDPRDDHGVARVIVRYAEDYNPDTTILYELRFDFPTP
ncbi:MAG: hypothetical protein ACLFUS_00855 [Candidatus Sumerlaeia bacterium]